MHRINFDVPTNVDDEEIVDITKPSIRLYNNDALSRDYERILRMSHVVTKFASTLCLRHIQAHVDESDVNSLPAPAWSDADNIWFGRAKLGSLVDPKVVTAIKGLTIHEISHILMTPRVGSNLGTWVRQNDLWRAWNALEDMRIECFMTTKYPSTANWLIATIAQHLLQNQDQYTVSFPLIYGRKYLPQELRDAITQMYEDQPNVAEISSLIDQYIVLNLADKNDALAAQPIIERYNELVNGLPQVNPEHFYGPKGWQRISDPNSHDTRKNGELKSSGTSKPMSKAEQDAIIERLKKRLANQQQSGQQNTSDDSGGTGDASTAPGESNSTGDPSGQPGGGASGGTYTGQIMSDTMDKILNGTLDTVNKKLADDINQTISQFNGDADLVSGKVKTPEKRWSIPRTVSTEAAIGSKTFARELEELRAEHDPAWDRRVDSGRLNIQRYAVGCDVEEAFDKWDIGREDAVDIEAVVLLDISPSMSWNIDQSYENMWAIKRALDKINASTTVLTFAETAHVLYSANERAEVSVRYGGMDGSTEPLNALRYAKYLLAESNRAIKLLIVITDGAWYGSDEPNNIIRTLRSAGVITSLAFVDDTEWWNANYGSVYKREGTQAIDTHGAEVAVLVNKPQDLFELAKRVVRAGIQRNLSVAK